MESSGIDTYCGSRELETWKQTPMQLVGKMLLLWQNINFFQKKKEKLVSVKNCDYTRSINNDIHSCWMTNGDGSNSTSTCWHNWVNLTAESIKIHDMDHVKIKLKTISPWCIIATNCTHRGRQTHTVWYSRSPGAGMSRYEHWPLLPRWGEIFDYHWPDSATLSYHLELTSCGLTQTNKHDTLTFSKIQVFQNKSGFMPFFQQ